MFKIYFIMYPTCIINVTENPQQSRSVHVPLWFSALPVFVGGVFSLSWEKQMVIVLEEARWWMEKIWVRGHRKEEHAYSVDQFSRLWHFNAITEICIIRRPVYSCLDDGFPLGTMATATRFRRGAVRVEHDDNNIKVKHFKIIKTLCIAGLLDFRLRGRRRHGEK